MGKGIEIRCKDLGVDHDASISGTSLEDLIDCVERTLREAGVSATSTDLAQLIRDTARSAVLQASRPESKRSVKLSRLIASLMPDHPQVRSKSWKVTA